MKKSHSAWLDAGPRPAKVVSMAILAFLICRQVAWTEEEARDAAERSESSVTAADEGAGKFLQARIDSFLDKPIKHFEADAGQEFFALCLRHMKLPCGLEGYGFGDVSKIPALKLSNTSPREILNQITQRYPDYHWAVNDEVLNLSPRAYVGKDLLSQKLASFSTEKQSSYKAALDALYQAEIVYSIQVKGKVPSYAQPKIGLQTRTVRDVLNQIVRSDKKAMWAFIYSTVPDSRVDGTFVMPSWRRGGAQFSVEEKQAEGKKHKSRRVR